MKNLLKLIFILALLSIYSCEEQLPEPIAVTSVSLNAESIEMTEGDQLELIATVSPNNAENKTIIWSSSNASIASVVNGKVTALKAGKATITVKTDDGGKTATCEVTVNKKEIPKAESLQIGFVNISGMKDGYFLIDKVYDFFATAYPEDAITEYEWSVEDTDIATISDNTQTPRLTTKNYGDTPIIVKDKISGVSASYIVKTCITDFKFNSASSITLTVGENYKLNSSYSPAKATGVFKRLSSFRFREFDSSTGNYIEVPNPSCFDITKNGFITAKKAGKTLMQIKEDGIYGSNSEIMITVVENVSNVILDKNNIELVEGDSFTLTATIIPSDAVNKNVRWSSSNTSVASVSNGKVTALKAGKATITVTTVDGGKTATCNVTVVEPPKATSLSLSDSSINGYIYRDHSKIYRVSISASPSNAVTDYQWSSSNTRVAKVQAGSNSCIIYTEDYGEAIISVTDKRTGLSASMTIHTLVEDFTWNESNSETMYVYPMITVYLN